ncbi:MAG TPA: prolyl oligopeptidase family serine peptidase [Candidatus Krumholzibacteria bacterium]|nr:prolyl oligopeptidase family serine peptidase [Candidatus Krumholzibacteria bacterium]
MRLLPAFVLLFAAASTAVSSAEKAQYKQPPSEIIELVDAPVPPLTQIDPQGKRLMQVDIEPNPPLSLLARPFHSLAGLRVDLERRARQRTKRNLSLSFVDLESGKTARVALPAERDFTVPVWSPDGTRVAFGVDTPQGVELWIADARDGKAARIAGAQLNDLLGEPIQWHAGSAALLVRMIPENLGPLPQQPPVPEAPVVVESSGKRTRMFTYQDLLENEFDADLFEHVATSQLAVVDVATGALTRVGEPGLVLECKSSPDGKFLLVTRLRRPFSYRVPYFYFAREIQVQNLTGAVVRTLASLPVSDEVPVQGVVKGPRDVEWQPLHPAKLLWVEALDEGDPQRKVPQRESVLTLAAPFVAPPTEVMRLAHRSRGFEFGARQDEVWVTEYERERRWITTYAVDLGSPQHKRVLFDRSVNDAYGDPGQPLMRTLDNGMRVLRQDGNRVYLAGRGATPEGARPFLDRFDVVTKKTERLFRSSEGAVESALGFVGDGKQSIVTRYESRSEPPNYAVVELAGGDRRQVTHFADPYPSLQGVDKRLLKYTRADGVALSGTLYLPPAHRAGERLPCLVWAYPLEYSDPATAGQVRASPDAFTLYRGASPLFFVTQGYAVLMDATMPVIGDPETMNETFVEQIVAAATAAVHTLDSLGVVDPQRVVVSGHSYGAFMTANLLAHSDLFAAGIARSGAYNRTLTPFGFQGERRSFWEASDVYMKLSPFAHAHRIDEPILLIHGQADNNPGTYTIQSERMYEALQAHGATARLVLLPHESHQYAARESILHTLAEMLEWSDRYVKQRVTTTATTEP